MGRMDDLITAQEAAELLHMHVKRVQRMARDGKLPAVRYGRKWLCRRRRAAGGGRKGGVVIPSVATQAAKARNRSHPDRGASLSGRSRFLASAPSALRSE